MEKATLEDVIQRLDRLEKMMTAVNQQIASLAEALRPEPPKDCEARARARGAEALKNSKQDDHTVDEVMDRLFEKLGIPPDFDPGSLEDLHESMRQHGIHAEDNEFSRAIIAEREK